MPTKKQALDAKNREYKAKVKARGGKLDAAGRKLSKSYTGDKPMKQFWDNVPRDEMVEALKSAESEKLQCLVNYMLKPNVKFSMARACREAGITLQELNELWAKHNLALGMIQVNSHLPKVLSDTAIDAESHFEICSHCKGTGEVTVVRMVENEDGEEKAEKVIETCIRCKGEREIRVPGDSKSRDQIFEMVGLTGKTGPLVAIQQNTINASSYEDAIDAAQKVLTKPITIEAKEVKSGS